MKTPLLSTKFNQPQLRANIVPRSRLVECLSTSLIQDGVFRRKLSLVSAPAGYGKTTLIVDWINKNDFPVGWVSLEEADNDPRRFIAYLIAAMMRVDAGIGLAATTMLQSPQGPPDDVLLTTLVNEISNSSQPFIVVLDDYHSIHTLAIHQQITFLLDHQPPNLHLVIITREDPLLPIARLRARGQLLEIGQADLRFTVDESLLFFEQAMGLRLNSDEVATLDQRTEGWIAGLQLAALSMQERGDLSNFIQAFTGSNRFILDYLIEEVVEQQPPEFKDFLLKTSILERLSGPLCNAVTESIDSQHLLEALEQANLFIVALDQSRQWFRYHCLFLELLQHRLRLSDLPEKALHLRASTWFEENGFMSDAIQHALAGQDWDRAAHIIQDIYADFLKRGEVLTVIGWFQSLPEEMLFANPKLCFDYCWPLLLASQYDEAEPLLAHVEQAAKDHPLFLGEIYAAQAYLARGRGNHERMVEYSQDALKLLPRTSIDTRGIVAINLGLAYWHMGQMAAAEEVLNEALESGRVTENHYVTLTALIFLGRVLAVRGQLPQAMEFFERAIHQGGEIPINALAHMDLAALHYEWNELENCDRHLHEAILLCQRSKNYEFLVGALMIQARSYMARGDFISAEESLEQALVLIHDKQIPDPTAARVLVAQAYLAWAKGESLDKWEQELAENIDCHPYYRFLGVAKARALQNPEASAYLNDLSATAQANEWLYGWIAVRILQAVSAESKEEAMRYLTEALQRAEPGGFIRSFVEVGEKIIPLLRELIQQGIMVDFTKRLLAVMITEVDSPNTLQPGLVEPLSARELEVLKLVAYGMTNREIADKLVISTGTAKTHVHNLCGKLGVRNRTEAAIKAKLLDLI